MVTKFHGILFAVLAVCLLLASDIDQAFAHSDNPNFPQTKIKYDTTLDGVVYTTVKNYLKEETKKHYGVMYDEDRDPFIAIGRVDLNFDGKDEIIAYYFEDIVVCDAEKSKCPYYIFTYTGRGLIKIGEFIAVGLDIADTKTNGIADLNVYIDDHNPKKIAKYKWAGRSYKLAEN
jgi:hypothetical protein